MSIKRHDRSTTPYGASVNRTTGAWCIFRRDYVVMTAGPSAPPAEIAALFSVAPRIASRQRGRLRHPINPKPPGIRIFRQRREQQAPRTRPEIENAPRAGMAVQRRLDKRLRVGTRNEGRRRHLEIERPEPLVPQDERHRLMREPPRQQSRETGRIRLARKCDQIVMRHPKGMGDKQPRLERRIVEPSLAQRGGRLAERAHSCAASRAAWSSAVSASMKSSKSPCMTRSIL